MPFAISLIVHFSTFQNKHPSCLLVQYDYPVPIVSPLLKQELP